ncbi:MAG: hypothetical protein ACR2KU_11255 [Gammaproteobacteria bacterium]
MAARVRTLLSPSCDISGCYLVRERIHGDHHIFSMSGIEEMLNLRPRKSLAKRYQMNQVRRVMVRYKLEPKDAE